MDEVYFPRPSINVGNTVSCWQYRSLRHLIAGIEGLCLAIAGDSWCMAG